MEVIITPTRKRFTVEIVGETFKTQKSLIERVKPIFEHLGLQKNQKFIQAFVSTYDKVQRQNKAIKKVYYGPNKDIPSYFKQSKCLHVVFDDESEITVGYKNIVSACFDPESQSIRAVVRKRIAEYRTQIARDIIEFRTQNIQNGCAICNINFLENYDSPCPHVDHCGEKEFRHIVADYENQCEEKDFVKFHRSLAKYQLLCEDCHYKKPNKW